MEASASSAQLLAGVESGMDADAGVSVPDMPAMLGLLVDGAEGERPLAACA